MTPGPGNSGDSSTKSTKILDETLQLGDMPLFLSMKGLDNQIVGAAERDNITLGCSFF